MLGQEMPSCFAFAGELTAATFLLETATLAVDMLISSVCALANLHEDLIFCMLRV